MKAVFFGAGKMLSKVVEVATNFEIIAIADNSTKKQGTEIFFRGQKYCVQSSDVLLTVDFDVVILSVSDSDVQAELLQQLQTMDIPFDKILYFYNGSIRPLPQLRPSLDYNGEKRILYDVSEISKRDYGTGIQRVVNNLYENLKDKPNLKVVRYLRLYDKYITSRKFENSRRGEDFDEIESEIVLTDNDTLFVPDLSLKDHCFALKNNSMAMARKLFMIHDILPVLMPENFLFSDNFVGWLNEVLKYANGLLCTTKTVAIDVRRYYESKHFEREKSLPVYIFDLGFDIPAGKVHIRDRVRDFVKANPTFLMVGTVEPRKNHLQAMKAFAMLYEDNPFANAQLLIVGRDGWLNNPFKEFYSATKRLQHAVMWVKDADDGEMRWAYENCVALLYPTKNEGYGLPLVEAAYHGLPILCNDIPVFHELAGDHVTYFNADNLETFKKAVVDFLAAKEHPDSRKIKLCTWEESARQVYDIITNRAEPYFIL